MIIRRVILLYRYSASVAKTQSPTFHIIPRRRRLRRFPSRALASRQPPRSHGSSMPAIPVLLTLLDASLMALMLSH